ncbi:putative methyltransferase type 11 [Rosellinia necatrix]|uniref:Putative methyltransferase type 11 n=1 Tax=Rosellinia necatrix TaxID=77044 RepID=A0A1W2TAF8_ROSNE|nr:putative methyltransferase type 11 [Rosellinia necatrix]
MNIKSWLEGVPTPSRCASRPTPTTPTSPPIRKRKQQQQQQQAMPTPTSSVANDNDPEYTPHSKRRRLDEERDNNDDDDDGFDIDRTPRAKSSNARSASASASNTSSHHSSSTASRASPTKHLAKLELASEKNPIIVQQITQNDARMPDELKAMLKELKNFQRASVVPDYLEAEIRARAEHDSNLDDITDATYGKIYEDGSTWPTLSLYHILQIYESAKECFNEDHAEATWNAIVHWPVFDLAVGPMVDVPEVGHSKLVAGDGQGHDDQNQRDSHHQHQREKQVRVRGMPCTAARLKGRPRTSKMVDFCFFVEPEGRVATVIDELRESIPYINHTDYNALRRRPIVLSVESKKPGEGFRKAHLQLGVWQAAQWTFLLDQLPSKSKSKDDGNVIPFLPGVIIQGHDWYFTASTRFHNTTILWTKQPIGTTESILGIFQVVCVLRHITTWIRKTYWPWYRLAILNLRDDE